MAEANQLNTKPKKGKKRKYPMAFGVGITVLALAFVGVISILVGVIQGITVLQDDTKQREEITAAVAMAVNMDPLPFESVAKADKDFLLNISAWTALNKADKETLRTTDAGMLLLPKSDVEVAFKTLFGSDNHLNYMPTPKEDDASTGMSMQILYDKQTNCYQIPSSAYVESVKPLIPADSKLVRKGDQYYVKVGYCNSSLSGEAVTEEAVYKYMTYVMRYEKDHFVIDAVLELQEDEKDQSKDTTKTTKTTKKS